MSGDSSERMDRYREELGMLPPPDDCAQRHLDILRWLTRLSDEFGYSKPILVGCGAVELYTSSCTATGDVDIITKDMIGLSAALLVLGFQRSNDQRFVYHPGYSILIEFPDTKLRPGEETISIDIGGTECRIISPVDLIVDRLETFEASGGGIDLVHAYQIYHLLQEELDHDRLRDRVRRADVRESFRFVRKLHDESGCPGLSIEEQGAKLVEECYRRRGLSWPTGLS